MGSNPTLAARRRQHADGRPHGHNGGVQVITLKPRPPVRAFAVAAGLAVLGAVALVAGDLLKWGVVGLVLGIILIVAALLLALAGVGTMARMRVTVNLDDKGFTVIGPDGERSRDWSDVLRVTQSASGKRITFHNRDMSKLQLISHSEGVEMARLRAAIIEYLDASRGYGLHQLDDDPEAS